MYPQNDLSLRRELHAHDVRARRARSTSRTTCWCARWTASSSCTPTTSRTPRPRRCACAGSSGANPVRLHRGRHRLPVGPGARRRQRGVPEHAGGDRRRRRKIGEFIKQVKDKNSSVKLMGFGHRVYKNYDPRAKLMRETCHEVLDELGLHDDPLFKLAMALEKIALEDDYFVEPQALSERRLLLRHRAARDRHPGQSCSPRIFALARTVGWIAQWNEMIADPEQKIGRPRQLYTGAARRRDVRADRTSASRGAQARSGVAVMQSDHDEADARQFVPVRRQRAVHRGAVRVATSRIRQSVPEHGATTSTSCSCCRAPAGMAEPRRRACAGRRVLRAARQAGRAASRRRRQPATLERKQVYGAAADRRLPLPGLPLGATSIRSSACERPPHRRARAGATTA